MSYQQTGLSPKKIDLFNKIYYTPLIPASFGSKANLLKTARKKYPTTTKEEVENWLLQQPTYTLHKQQRNVKLRNYVVAEDVDEQYQADIVDMKAFERFNDGYKYILTAVDVLSKFAFAIPVKDKSGKSLKAAFEKIFSLRIPQKIQTDKGLEFLNTHVQTLFKNNNIQFFTSNNNEIKCSNVERFNRTLKSKLWKYFTGYETKRWIDVIDQIVYSYNTSEHRITKKQPIKVTNENSKQVFQTLYGFPTYRSYLKSKLKKTHIRKPNIVRIRNDKNLFEKGYTTIWSDKAYKVEKIIKGDRRPTYVMYHLNKKFYPEQIQDINLPFNKIENILKSRLIKGEREYLVKWNSYPKSYLTWEGEEVLKQYLENAR